MSHFLSRLLVSSATHAGTTTTTLTKSNYNHVLTTASFRHQHPPSQKQLSQRHLKHDDNTNKRKTLGSVIRKQYHRLSESNNRLIVSLLSSRFHESCCYTTTITRPTLSDLAFVVSQRRTTVRYKHNIDRSYCCNNNYQQQQQQQQQELQPPFSLRNSHKYHRKIGVQLFVTRDSSSSSSSTETETETTIQNSSLILTSTFDTIDDDVTTLHDENELVLSYDDNNDDDNNNEEIDLSFERPFDFSTNPRWDTRFQNDLNGSKIQQQTQNDETRILRNSPSNKLSTKRSKEKYEIRSSISLLSVSSAVGSSLNDDEFQQLSFAEAAEDAKELQRRQDYYSAYEKLSPTLVAQATEVLRPYVRPDRIERIESILQQRTKQTRFLFENPVNPSNVFACLRTLDAFGIQNVDIIIDRAQYKGKAAVSQKRGMRTAVGSAQWLTVNYHLTTEQAITSIRQQTNKNCMIYASDLRPTSQDIRTINWNQKRPTNHQTKNEDGANGSYETSDNKGDDDPIICIVMGNEERGISDTMKSLVDATFTLPMVGFAESFNLSVATAITLAHLSARSSSGCSTNGPIRPGNLQEHQYNCLVLKGLMNSVAQKRIIQPLLKQANIILPPEIISRI